MPPERMRWRDFHPTSSPVFHDPDALVSLTCKTTGQDHGIYEHDCALAARLLERLEELGGSDFRASLDVCHMRVCNAHVPVIERGYRLNCDDSLPPNSVYKVELTKIGDVTDLRLIVDGVDLAAGGDWTMYIEKPRGG